MSFTTDLDKYLTTPPPEFDDAYTEAIYEHYSDEFYDNLEDFEGVDLEYKWIEKLERKAISPELASKIIERAYRLYFKEKKD